MGKLSFLTSIVGNIDFKNLKSTVKIVCKRSGKPKPYIYFDILRCALCYGAGYNDYRFYNFEELSAEQRKTYVTRAWNNKIVSMLNDSEYTHFLSNKDEFNKRFAKYIHRKWIDIRCCTKEEFDDFLQGIYFIMAKTPDGCCGKGVVKYTVSDWQSTEELYEHLKKNNEYLVEEYIVQHSEMSRIYPCSVNTVRIATINCGGQINVAYAMIRIGNNGKNVDNLNSGGMSAPVDVATGVITHPAYDKTEKVYYTHPYTKQEIVGFKIPNWEKAKALCIEAAAEIPQLGYIGWDVCIKEDDVLIIEANEYPGHDILQLPCHLNEDKKGMLPMFKKYIPNL